MKQITEICNIDTAHGYNEIINVSNCRLITSVQPFSIEFIYDNKNIKLNTNGFFITYSDDGNNVIVSATHNILYIMKHAMMTQFNLSNDLQTKHSNYDISIEDKVFSIDNVISYDINTPYQEKFIDNDMLYYQLKLFNELEIIYDCNTFKVFYQAVKIGRYEILYRNNKIVIYLIKDDDIKEHMFYHKTMYFNVVDNNSYYEKTWINQFNKECRYIVYKFTNRYCLYLIYENKKRDFVLYYDDHIYLTYKSKFYMTYNNIAEFLKVLNRNFLSFMTEKFTKHKILNKRKNKINNVFTGTIKNTAFGSSNFKRIVDK
jgi:hypothetical protein